MTMSVDRPIEYPAFRRQYCSNNGAHGERWDIFCALPPQPRSILDVGCGVGLGFHRYRAQGSKVVGVDIDPGAVAEASRRLDEAIVLDLEREPWPEHFTGAFDVVAFCDCVEHLRDPWAVLRSVRPLLTPDGVVVASIPNVRQIRVLGKLILGRFEYVRGPGIVQRDHLRFFTRQTIDQLFDESGYERPTYHFPAQTFHLRTPERILNALTLGSFADLLYNSFTVSSRPKRTNTSGAPRG